METNQIMLSAAKIQADATKVGRSLCAAVTAKGIRLRPGFSAWTVVLLLPGYLRGENTEDPVPFISCVKAKTVEAAVDLSKAAMSKRYKLKFTPYSDIPCMAVFKGRHRDCKPR